MKAIFLRQPYATWALEPVSCTCDTSDVEKGHTVCRKGFGRIYTAVRDLPVLPEDIGRRMVVASENDSLDFEGLELYKQRAAQQFHGPKFKGIPEYWLDKTHYICSEGHVTAWYVSNEVYGPICHVCRTSVILVPPEWDFGEDYFIGRKMGEVEIVNSYPILNSINAVRFDYGLVDFASNFYGYNTGIDVKNPSHTLKIFYYGESENYTTLKILRNIEDQRHYLREDWQKGKYLWMFKTIDPRT